MKVEDSDRQESQSLHKAEPESLKELCFPNEQRQINGSIPVDKKQTAPLEYLGNQIPIQIESERVQQDLSRYPSKEQLTDTLSRNPGSQPIQHEATNSDTKTPSGRDQNSTKQRQSQTPQDYNLIEYATGQSINPSSQANGRSSAPSVQVLHQSLEQSSHEHQAEAKQLEIEQQQTLQRLAEIGQVEKSDAILDEHSVRKSVEVSPTRNLDKSNIAEEVEGQIHESASCRRSIKEEDHLLAKGSFCEQSVPDETNVLDHGALSKLSPAQKTNTGIKEDVRLSQSIQEEIMGTPSALIQDQHQRNSEAQLATDEKLGFSIDAPQHCETMQSEQKNLSQMSRLRESRLDDQVDLNVDKILKILCKVLLSEVTTEVSQASWPIKTGQQNLSISFVDSQTKASVVYTEAQLASNQNLTSVPLLSEAETNAQVNMFHSEANQSIDYIQMTEEKSHSPEKENARKASVGSSTEESRRKIYGVLSEKQKHQIRLNNAIWKVVKKPNPMRVGADYKGNFRKTSPYAFDQKKNVMESVVKVISNGNAQERSDRRAKQNLSSISKELQIQKERQTMHNFDTIVSVEKPKSPKTMNKNVILQGQNRTVRPQFFEPILKSAAQNRKPHSMARTGDKAMFFPKQLTQKSTARRQIAASRDKSPQALLPDYSVRQSGASGHSERINNYRKQRADKIHREIGIINEVRSPMSLSNAHQIVSPMSLTVIPGGTEERLHQTFHQQGATLPSQQTVSVLTAANHRESPTRPQTQDNLGARSRRRQHLSKEYNLHKSGANRQMEKPPKKFSEMNVTMQDWIQIDGGSGSLQNQDPSVASNEPIMPGILGISQVTSKHSQQTARTARTFSKQLASRQERLLSNVIGVKTQQNPSTSRMTAERKKFIVPQGTADLSGRWATVENSTMISPVTMQRRKQKQAKPFQVKVNMSRYQKASSLVYSTRQEQILGTYLQSRPQARGKMSPPRSRHSPKPRRPQQVDANLQMNERKAIDFHPILQPSSISSSHGTTLQQHVE